MLELSLALVIIGIITVPFVALYKAEHARERSQEALWRTVHVVDSVGAFFSSGNEFYPCPASLTAALGDADFGIQAPLCNLSDIDDCDGVSWMNNQGVCKTSDDPATAVLIGGVPFTALKMAQGEELDVWGNKLIYAVGFNQTTSATFSNGRAIIPFSGDQITSNTADGIPDQVTDQFGNAVRYEYIVLSTGDNGVGGFTKDGTRISDCDNGGNILSELENCDFDETFLLREDPNLTNTGVASLSNLYYDDYTSGLASITEMLWYENSNEEDVAMTLSTRVGIGTQEPQDALHVSSRNQAEANILIQSFVNEEGTREGGQLQTDEICTEVPDDNGSTVNTCFNPRLIAGDVDEMDCDSNRAVTELSNSRVTCTTTEDAQGNEINGESLSTGNSFSGECSEQNSQGGTVSRPATGFGANGELTC